MLQKLEQVALQDGQSVRTQYGLPMSKTVLTPWYLTWVRRIHGKCFHLGESSLEAIQGAVAGGLVTKVREATLRLNQANTRKDLGQKVAKKFNDGSST